MFILTQTGNSCLKLEKGKWIYVFLQCKCIIIFLKSITSNKVINVEKVFKIAKFYIIKL